MFGWEYPPLHSGGLGVACQGLVRGLLKNGVEITLVLPTASDENQIGLTLRGPEDEAAVIRYVRSALQPYENVDEYAERVHGSPSGKNVQDLYGADMNDAVVRFTKMSVAMTQDAEPDIVHCHDWMTYGAGIEAANYHDVPLVAHIHATEMDRTDFHPNTWIAEQERRGLLAADRVIAVSHYTNDILVNRYGIPAEKISVVHNGHDQATVASENIISSVTKRAPIVLFLGRLTVQKNPWQFLETAKIVHDFRPDVQFVMAGEGSMQHELMEHACDLGLTDCVTFTGKVAREDVSALYGRASCFVMPSLSEPFGLVALEAIGHGVPVVLSKQSGAAEVIDHAFKVDFWDTERFADCILTILRETPLADQLRAEAPRILQRLSWKNQAAAVNSIYQDLLSA
jgi:glycosyltransferase involved in cell wall biosynthesis